VSTKFIPCEVTEEQKKHCLFLASELLRCGEGVEDTLKRSITSDQT
jgi:hypothetical protein